MCQRGHTLNKVLTILLTPRATPLSEKEAYLAQGIHAQARVSSAVNESRYYCCEAIPACVFCHAHSIGAHAHGMRGTFASIQGTPPHSALRVSHSCILASRLLPQLCGMPLRYGAAAVRETPLFNEWSPRLVVATCWLVVLGVVRGAPEALAFR